VSDITELKRQGLSIQAISALTGFDRKTIRKYLKEPAGRPVYQPRPEAESKLDSFKPYLSERLKAGVWNARALMRELRERGYTGGYTILTDWLRPQRREGAAVAVRRFETPAGHQGQMDWGHLGSIVEADGTEHKLWGFVLTLGYSRVMIAEAALDQKLGTLLRLHERAFEQLGGVPCEILYDRMKTVVSGVNERGETEWNRTFLDFAQYWGFTPRLCRPYRAQTKGKVESGVKYLRRNFLCGLQGREPGSVDELNAELRRWLAEVANQRIHGTTHEAVQARWDREKPKLQPLDNRRPFPYLDLEDRTATTDAYVNWEASQYSVPWQYAGKSVSVTGNEERVDVHYGQERIARHRRAEHRHSVIREDEHHAGLPYGAPPARKTLLRLRQTAPVVEDRPLSVYDTFAGGGGQ
jgi:transposase